MSVLNQSGEEQVECPLCMEPLEVDDLNFFPCTCGYQICRFCWHRIRTDENGLCPACRKAYPENPADFKPLSQQEVAKLKAEKRHKDQLRKQKITENRKHLANVRVVQKNLVYVNGLHTKLADVEMLKKHEYFGKFGKIHKVVINQSTSYAGTQGQSATAYVTYHKADDALRAIQAVNNISIHGRTIKASLGTTKYCSHFMKNQTCPKLDCMYLHDLGDVEASFTKEEMQQGKHQEYEKKLHEQLLNSYNKDRKPTPSPPAVALSTINYQSGNNTSTSCVGNNQAQGNQTCHTSQQPLLPDSQSASPSHLSQATIPLQLGQGSSCSSSTGGSVSSLSSSCSNTSLPSALNKDGCNGGSSNNSGNNQRRQKDSKQLHKKRHSSTDDSKGKQREKVHSTTLEDHLSKAIHNKINVLNVHNSKNKTAKENLGNNVTQGKTSNSSNKISEKNDEFSESEVANEMDSNVCVASTSGRFHANGGRLANNRAVTLFEPDNNSFFSTSNFTKVSTATTISAGVEWPLQLSGLGLAHMPDVLPVHSSEDWQAAFGFSEAKSNSQQRKTSETCATKSAPLHVDMSVTQDCEKSEMTNNQTSTLSFNNSGSALLLECSPSATKVGQSSVEDIRFNSVENLSKKLNNFSLDKINGMESVVVNGETTGPSGGNRYVLQRLPANGFTDDPNYYLIRNSHDFLNITNGSEYVRTSVVPQNLVNSVPNMVNGVPPISQSCNKFNSDFQSLQEIPRINQNSSQILNGVMDNYNSVLPLVHQSVNNVLSKRSVSKFKDSDCLAVNSDASSKTKSVDENDTSVDKRYSNYAKFERQKSGENSADSFLEIDRDSESGEQCNEEIGVEESRQVIDDELDFDPFHETQKALAEMIEKESLMSSVHGQSSLGIQHRLHMQHLLQQKQHYHNLSNGNANPLKVSQLGFLGKQPTPYAHPSNLMLVQNQRLPHQISGCTKLLDGFSSNTPGSPVGSSQQRARFPGAPPPGFTNGPNHMNAFGLGIPRAPSSAGSKILPFMGLGNSADSTINGSSSPVPQANSISNNLSHVQLLSTQSNQNQVIYPSPGSRGSTPNNLTATSFGMQNCLSNVQSAFKSTTGDCYNVQEWSDHIRPVISNISGNHRNSPSPVAGLQRNTPSPTIHQSSVFGLTTTSGSNIPPKVWNGAGPCSDWTALDPAIMSSSRPHSITNLATTQPPSLAHTHPLILHNTGSQVIQPNISSYLHMQSPHLPGHWLQSLPQDSRVLYNSNSPSVSSSDWNVSSHRSPTHPIAPPPPGFPGHITNHQQMKRINSPQRDMTNS